MIAEAIMYHLAIVKLLLLVLLLNLATPWFAKQLYSKWVRTGFFLFSGFIGMVIFSGIVIFIFMGGNWTIRTVIMSFVAFLLILLEVKRVRTIANCWKNGTPIAQASMKYVALELVMLTATTIWLIASN